MAEKSRKEKKSVSVVGQAAQLAKLRHQIFVAAIICVAVLLGTTAATFIVSTVQSDQLEITMALNQYRNGSKTLTSEVQSYAVTGNQIYCDNYMKELNIDKNRDIAIETLQKHDITADEWAKFDEISAMSNGLVPLEEAAMASVGAGDLISAQESVFGEQYEETVIRISALTDEVINEIQHRKAGEKTLFQMIQIISQIVFFATCGYVIYGVFKIIKFSTTDLLVPIVKVSEQMGHLANGNFDVPLDLVEDESEVGKMVESISFMKSNMSKMIAEISQILGAMSDGDYRVDVKQDYVGAFIEIRESLIKIGDAMRETLHTLRDVTEQIDGGSEQLACAAQDLAEGSTTQALQVAQVAEAIKRMTESMQNNAMAAEKSVGIASAAGKTLVTGNEKMEELKVAIGEISKCSEEIGTIINAIEDIASQTNLLSLNAAIEAARAGEAGRGFAVVAEQVKNLAEESAKAAGKTTELIQTTIDAVNKGIEIADETAANMVEVMNGAKEATEEMSQIAKILDQEADNMKDINETVSSVSIVVDNNSATSEETAAVSEEQKAQVETMVQMMSHFKI